MSEQLRESLSAAMDDEADAFELRRVLDEVQGDPALRCQWQRLHMIRDLMQKKPQAYAPQLRDAIWSELLAEQTGADDGVDVVAVSVPHGKSPKSPGVFWRRLAGSVVAATVALVVVLNGDIFQDDTEIAQDLSVPSAGLQVVGGQITPADRQRRNAYYVRHAQFRGMHQIGVASFTKLATFDESDMQAGEEPELPSLD